jgi:hypothetical protein
MKRESQRLRVLQVNLHYRRAASAALCVVIRNCDVSLNSSSDCQDLLGRRLVVRV